VYHTVRGTANLCLFISIIVHQARGSDALLLGGAATRVMVCVAYALAQARFNPVASNRTVPLASPIGAAATAFALIGFAAGGSGSVFDISHAREWRRMLEARVPIHIDVGMTDDSQEQRPDLRSASEHLGNIRQVLNSAIADLATVFGVSRQAVYKWIGGEATPEPDQVSRASPSL